MKRWFVVVFMLLGGCTSVPHIQQVDTQYGTYAYALSGENEPTVVFESGLGDDMTSWQVVLEQMTGKARAFSYNRAGFRGSQSSVKARNGAVIVAELKDILETLNLTPPFILVGHSLGGGYMELFAKTYPSLTAGLVLVDPNASKYPSACKAQKLEFCDPPSGVPVWASWFLPDAVVGEISGFAKTHEQINQIDDFPDVPLVVLSAPNSRAAETEQQQKANALYRLMHQQLAQQSSQSKYVECEHCSHYLHQDEPQMVVEAIEWVHLKSKRADEAQ